MQLMGGRRASNETRCRESEADQAVGVSNGLPSPEKDARCDELKNDGPTDCVSSDGGPRTPTGAHFWEAEVISVRRQGRNLLFANVEVIDFCPARAVRKDIRTERREGVVSASALIPETSDAEGAADEDGAAERAPAAVGFLSGSLKRVQLIFSRSEYWAPFAYQCEGPSVAPGVAAAATERLTQTEVPSAAAKEDSDAAADGESAAPNGIQSTAPSIEALKALGGPDRVIPFGVVSELLPQLRALQVLATRAPTSPTGCPTFLTRVVLRVEACPNYFAFSRVESLWRRGALSDTQVCEALEASTGPSGTPLRPSVEALKRANPREVKLTLKAWARTAAGLKPQRANRRQKLCAADAAFLDGTATLRGSWPIKGASEWDCTTLDSSGSHPESAMAEKAKCEAGLLNLGDLPVERKTEERVRWIVNRKLPQIEWFVEQIKPLYEAKKKQHSGMDWEFVVVDVGGGRGDLSLALAAAFPRVSVQLIDSHKPSTEALRLRLQTHHPTFNVRPVHADFRDLQYNLSDFPETPTVCGPGPQAPCRQGDEIVLVEGADRHRWERNPDLLVALHACGGLSDAVIASAVFHRCSFLVCCCCFSKHPELRAEALIPRLLKATLPATGKSAALGRVCLVCLPQHSFDGGPCAHRSCRLQAREEPIAPLPGSVGDDEELRTLFRLADSTDASIGNIGMWGALAWRASAAMRIAESETISESLRRARRSLQCKLLSFPESFSQKNLVLSGVFTGTD